MPRLHDPIRVGALEVRNRLYRAPVLEVVGTGGDAPRRLRRELAPGAEAGAGLLFQGACLVTPTGGRTAPGLLRFHDAEFVRSFAPAVAAVKAHGARLFVQLGHGALQCMELWHREYKAAHPAIETLAVSEPPWWFRALGGGLLDLSSVRVAREDELAALAQAFGRAARNSRDAGYEGIHLAGANASIFQQLWSPVFNRRRDAYGGATLRDRSRFLAEVVDAIRRATARDFPVTMKIPAETAAPAFVRGALTLDDGVEIARIAADLGLDAVAPVQVGVTRDQATARGKFPDVAWFDPRWQDGYDAAFGGAARKRLVRAANRAAAWLLPDEPAWNAPFARRVKRAVAIPVLLEGGIRTRPQMDALLAEGACDMVGMARPFYAEPRIPARLLADGGAAALCGSYNNCTIPQVTGAAGTCRTPQVLAARGRLEAAGGYRRKTGEGERRKEKGEGDGEGDGAREKAGEGAAGREGRGSRTTEGE